MKKAFTLAEVLITVAIVGIVAAITIPALVQKSFEKSTIGKLRKLHYNLQHVMETLKGEDIYVLSTEYTNKDLTNMFAKNLKATKICYPPNAKACMDKVPTYKTVGGGTATSFITNLEGAIVLADGTTIFFRYVNSNSWVQIFVDTNGSALPNRLGEDTFSFRIDRESKDLVLSPRGTTNWKDDVYCKPKVSTSYSHNGLGCTKWAVMQGNMNYLH
jgi:prepilin-type N-terminal cleavage/methylation domain-containing protein